ncbi:MAG: hypothetical protein QM504_06695 [Pseudomonadota bacterium]
MSQTSLNLETNDFQIKLDPLVYKGLSMLLYEAGIDGNNVVNDFMNYYVIYASKHSDKLVDICSQTGFSKHMVKKYIDESKSCVTPKSKAPYKSLISELKLQSVRQNGGLIQIYGKFQSFKYIYENYGPTAHESTAISTLEHLVKVGIIERHGRHIKFISTMPKIGCANLDTALKEFALMIHRLAHTIKHNLACKNNDETLFQAQYFTTSIDESSHKIVADELREIMRSAMKNCAVVIDKHEEISSFSRKMVESKSIEIGVSAFIFNNTKE